jgi:hypothetical protein
VTNSIGYGTRNLSVNVPTDERDILRRAAIQSGCQSLGDYIRRIVLRGVELDNQEAAEQIKQVRRQYYGLSLLTLFVTILAWSILHDHEQDFRRARNSRRPREEQIEEAKAA